MARHLAGYTTQGVALKTAEAAGTDNNEICVILVGERKNLHGGRSLDDHLLHGVSPHAEKLSYPIQIRSNPPPAGIFCTLDGKGDIQARAAHAIEHGVRRLLHMYQNDQTCRRKLKGQYKLCRLLSTR